MSLRRPGPHAQALGALPAPEAPPEARLLVLGAPPQAGGPPGLVDSAGLRARARSEASSSRRRCGPPGAWALRGQVYVGIAKQFLLYIYMYIGRKELPSLFKKTSKRLDGAGIIGPPHGPRRACKSQNEVAFRGPSEGL